MNHKAGDSIRSRLCSGILITWKDDRGFGFIRPQEGGEDVFLHISEVKDSTRRPQAQDTIYYYQDINKNGKACACNAFIAGARQETGSWRHHLQAPGIKILGFFLSRVVPLLVLPIFGAIHFFLATLNPIPMVFYGVMGWVTYLVYGHDKACAQQHRRRVPEKHLHVCEMLGGWPGGLMAQKILRHKSKKRSYQIKFWLIVIVHQIGWLGWLVFGKFLIE